MNIVISNKYKLIKTIGEGSFGKIFHAIDISNNLSYAVKIEKKVSKYSLLKNEISIYKRCNLTNIIGIPKLYEYGIQDNYNYMVIDLYDNTLEKIKNNKNILELNTVLVVALQIIKILNKLHQVGIIHRDIKPDNIIFNNTNSNKNNNNIYEKNTYYLIDYGLSKQYIDKNGIHREINTEKQLTGSIKYSSINVQNGIEPSRRDDLESLGYILIYLLKGNLPWQGAIGNTKQERNDYVINIKNNTSLIVLCDKIPYEFLLYMSYCRNLKYEEQPNYNYIYNIFYNLYKCMN